MTALTITFGDTIEGALNVVGQTDVYEVSLTAGVRYTFELKGASTASGTLVDPWLAVFYGLTRVAFNDDSGEGKNSLITFTPASSGTYLVAAHAFADNATGTYELSVSASDGSGITDDFAATVDTIGRLGTAGTAVTGNVQWAGDNDWFAVELPAGAVTIDLQGLPTGAGSLPDPYLQLLDANGTLVAFNDDAGVGSNALINYTVALAGTYYVSAGAYQGRGVGDYQVSVTAVAAAPSVDDYAGAATGSGTLVAGTPATGTIEINGDQDWFAVSLTPGTTYSIELNATATAGTPALADPYLRLFNAAGTLLRVNDDGGAQGHDSLISFTVPGSSGSPATYYVSAGGYGGRSAGSYTLVLTDTSASGADDDHPADMPGTIASDGTGVTGSIETAGDTDRFAITLDANTTYTFSLMGTATGVGTLADPYLRLYNASGSLQAFNDDGGELADSLITFRPTAAGTYYLSAAAYGDRGTGSYVLTATKGTGSGPSASDDFGSDTVAGAVYGTLTDGVGHGVIETAGDVDWFRVTLDAGKTYKFQVDGAATSDGTLGDPRMALIDANGRTIAINDDGGVGNNALITYTPTTGGDYFIAARDSSGRTTGDYTVRLSSGSGTNDSDILASIATTATLEIGQSRTGTLELPRDADWYRITLTAGTTYILEANGIASGEGTLADPNLRLYDGAGNLKAVNDDSGTGKNALLAYDARETGTYYLSASSPDAAATGTYTVRISQGKLDDYLGSVGTDGRLSPGVTVNASIETAGDQDWFRVHLEGGHDYTFRLDGFSTAAGTLQHPFLVLLDPTGTQPLGFADSTGVGTNALLTLRAPVTGEYLVAASASGSGTGTYQVSFAEGSAGGTPDDDVGNARALAKALQIDQIFNGRIEQTADEDWFSLVLTEGRRYEVSLDAGATGGLVNPELFLYDGNSLRPLLSDDDSGTGANALLSFLVPNNGNDADSGLQTFYFVALAHDNAGTGSYSIRVMDLGDDTQDDHLVESPGDSELINIGQEPGSIGNIETAGDVDRFYATFVEGREYVISVLGASSSMGSLIDPYLELLYVDDSAAAQLVRTNNDGGVGSDASIVYTATATGTYYFDVHAFNDTGTGTYRISVIDSSGGTDDYRADISTGGVVNLGLAVSGRIELAGDVDWVRVHMQTGNTYSIYADGAATSGGLADAFVSLYGASGNPVSGASDNDSGVGKNAYFAYQPTATGDYYLAVRSGTTGGTGAWNLYVYENDDQRASTGTAGTVATGAYPGGAFSGTLETSSDHDWFAFDVQAGARYVLRLSGDGATSTKLPFFIVRDADGNTVSSTVPGQDANHGSIIFFQPTQSGTYYLDMGSSTGFTGAYHGSIYSGDDFTASAPGRLVVDGAPVSGVVEVARDTDRFNVDLAANSNYWFFVRGQDSNAGTGLSTTGVVLFGSQQVASADSALHRDSIIGVRTSAAGTYTLDAGLYGVNTGSYQVSVVADDHGDTVATATPVGEGTTNGRIQIAGDVDFFSLGSLVAGVTYSLALDSRGSFTQPQLTLYSGNTAVSAGPDVGAYADVVLYQFTPTQSGPYSLKVAASNSQTGNYALTVVAAADLPETTATTGVVTLNGQPQPGAVDLSGDRDWFKVVLPQGGVSYAFWVDGAGSGVGTLGNPDVRLYAADGTTLLASADGGGRGNDAMVAFTPSAAGTYYLSAGASDGGTGTYRVAVSYASDDYRADAATGGVLQSGYFPGGNIERGGDVDWFRVTLSPGVWTFNVNRTSFLDPYAELYDGLGQLVASDDNNGPDIGAQIVWDTSTGTGPYYLAVKSATPGGTGDYQIFFDPFAKAPMGLVPLAQTPLQASALPSPAAAHLAEYGVTLAQAHDWVFAHMDAPQTIFDVASQYGVTTPMLAEIVGGGVTGAQVLGWFDARGIDAAPLDRAPASIFPNGEGALAPLLTLNDEAGVLDTEKLRAEVIARTGEAAYWHVFDPDRIAIAQDGVLTPQELGTDAVGTLEATPANLESLFYGTAIKLLESVDGNEATEIGKYLVEFVQPLAAGDAGARQGFLDLVAEAFATAEAPARFDADEIASMLVNCVEDAAREVGHGVVVGLIQPVFDVFL